MKVWLDDVRPAPEGWEWVYTVDEAKAVLGLWYAIIDSLSLDHDLGEDAEERSLPNGYNLTLWMAEHQIWPAGEIRIHSANPVGLENMAATILRYGPYKPSLDRRSFYRTD